MDWSNKEVLVNPNLSYTSRDYSSIYNQLISAVPNLTSIYNPKEEGDPGVVLIKLIAMLGDMLSFNLDNAALESYPRTVMQTKNARQIFRLVGYKMRGYRSATCEATFANANSVPIQIDRYSVFLSSNSEINYTNTDDIYIPAGSYGASAVHSILTQGVPVTPNIAINESAVTGEWHDKYDYNITASQISNNRLYLTDTDIDDRTIVLIDDDSTEFVSQTWQLVDNINTLTEKGKYFEFDFDSDGKPYIEFPEYWNSAFAISHFKLFYVKSLGSKGEIIDNAITGIESSALRVIGSTTSFAYSENFHIYNTASSYGYDPETPEEARRSAELYVNTIDTLVVLKDFSNATKRIQGIANAIATDLNTDPNREDLSQNQIRIYVIRKPGYDTSGESSLSGNVPYSTNISDEIWKESIRDLLDQHKLSRYTLEIFLDRQIDWIEWTVEGSLWLRQPIPLDKSMELMSKINDSLKYSFSSSNMNFAEAVNYVDVIDNIKSTDRVIYHVDLNSSSIQYNRIVRDHNGNPTGKLIKRRWKIYSTEDLYTGYYLTGIGCVSCQTSGDQSASGNRILKDDDAESSYGLDLGMPYQVNSYETFTENNVDEIYDWVNQQRIYTNHYIDYRDAKLSIFRRAARFSEVRTYDVGDVVSREIVLQDSSNSIYETYVCIKKIESPKPFDPDDWEVVDDYRDERYVLKDCSEIYLSTGESSHEILSHNYRDADGVQIPHYSIELTSSFVLGRTYSFVIQDDTEENTYSFVLPEFQVGDVLKYYANHLYLNSLLSEPIPLNYSAYGERIQLNEGYFENELTSVFDIINEITQEWTGRYIQRSSGEIFLVRTLPGSTHSSRYSTKKYYNEESGEITDGFGHPIYNAESGEYQKERVSKSELTGRYEQSRSYPDPSESGNYDFDFYLGQDENGDPMVDDVGNIISGFPIKPGTLAIFVDTDRYLLKDNGYGKLTGSEEILENSGSVDYSTGRVKFTLSKESQSSLKIIYYKNVVTMARYNSFNPEKFKIEPEFLRLNSANRSIV